jgi:multisubunit Na+/H+ antiporter MnhB subunit
MKRAHLHAGGMGTTAIAVIILLCLFGASRIITALTSLLLGAGGLGYAIFWMWAGFRAPGLGSTGAAKESLAWLALPSSGGFVLTTVAVFILLLMRLLAKREQEIDLTSVI